MHPLRHITVISLLAAISCGRSDGVRLSAESEAVGLLHVDSALTRARQAMAKDSALPPAPAAQDAPEPEAESSQIDESSLLGTFELTYYWITREPKTRSEQRTTNLYTRRCKSIAKVSKKFARRLSLEGTGKLRDGRVVSSAGGCSCSSAPCYFVTGKKYRWGAGVAKRPLSPFRSVAVDPDHVAIGQTLYVRELDGLTMPGKAPYGGWVHDGCVIADDRGGGVNGAKIDFFAAHRSHYSSLNKRHRLKQVTAYDGAGRCDHLVNGDKPSTVVAANRGSI